MFYYSLINIYLLFQKKETFFIDSYCDQKKAPIFIFIRMSHNYFFTLFIRIINSLLELFGIMPIKYIDCNFAKVSGWY